MTVKYKFNILVANQCLVFQFEGQIYYPQQMIYYDSMAQDKKIINFCLYVKFKFNSNVIFMTGDNNCIINANSNDINVWNPNTSTDISRYINEKGIV